MRKRQMLWIIFLGWIPQTVLALVSNMTFSELRAAPDTPVAEKLVGLAINISPETRLRYEMTKVLNSSSLPMNTTSIRAAVAHHMKNAVLSSGTTKNLTQIIQERAGRFPAITPTMGSFGLTPMDAILTSQVAIQPRTETIGNQNNASPDKPHKQTLQDNSFNPFFPGTFATIPTADVWVPRPTGIPRSATLSKCRGKTGYVADLEHNCQTFFNCLPDGSFDKLSCPAGLIFDQDTLSCQKPSASVTCSVEKAFDCTGKAGFYNDPFSKDRSSYFFCSPSGEKSHFRCPDGLLFNENCGACDLPQNCGPVTPASYVLSGPFSRQSTISATNAANQQNPPKSGGVEISIASNGKTDVTIAANLDQQPASTHIQQVPAPDNDFGFTARDNLQQNFDCSGKFGLFADIASGCTSYWVCMPNGPKHLMPCPAHLRFNENLGICDHPSRVSCSSLLAGGGFCADKIGFYPDPLSECRSYYFCSSEGRTYNFTCPGILLYNEVNGACDDPQNVDCLALSARTFDEFDCSGKMGLFADTSQNCHIYYSCNAFGKKTRLQCPSGQIFNERTGICDLERNVICSRGGSTSITDNSLDSRLGQIPHPVPFPNINIPNIHQINANMPMIPNNQMTLTANLNNRPDNNNLNDAMAFTDMRNGQAVLVGPTIFPHQPQILVGPAPGFPQRDGIIPINTQPPQIQQTFGFGSQEDLIARIQNGVPITNNLPPISINQNGFAPQVHSGGQHEVLINNENLAQQPQQQQQQQQQQQNRGPEFNQIQQNSNFQQSFPNQNENFQQSMHNPGLSQTLDIRDLPQNFRPVDQNVPQFLPRENFGPFPPQNNLVPANPVSSGGAQLNTVLNNQETVNNIPQERQQNFGMVSFGNQQPLNAGNFPQDRQLDFGHPFNNQQPISNTNQNPNMFTNRPMNTFGNGVQVQLVHPNSVPSDQPPFQNFQPFVQDVNIPQANQNSVQNGNQEQKFNIQATNERPLFNQQQQQQTQQQQQQQNIDRNSQSVVNVPSENKPVVNNFQPNSQFPFPTAQKNTAPTFPNQAVQVSDGNTGNTLSERQLLNGQPPFINRQENDGIIPINQEPNNANNQPVANAPPTFVFQKQHGFGPQLDEQQLDNSFARGFSQAPDFTGNNQQQNFIPDLQPKVLNQQNFAVQSGGSGSYGGGSGNGNSATGGQQPGYSNGGNSQGATNQQAYSPGYGGNSGSSGNGGYESHQSQPHGYGSDRNDQSQQPVASGSGYFAPVGSSSTYGSNSNYGNNLGSGGYTGSVGDNRQSSGASYGVINSGGGFDCTGRIGYYPDLSEDCRVYHYCKADGSKFQYRCPADLKYNASIGVCDWAKNVNCQLQRAGPANTPTWNDSPFFDCQGRSGFFGDSAREYRVFYYCEQDGRKHRFVCPSNLRFNDAKAACDWPENIFRGPYSGGQEFDCTGKRGYFGNPSTPSVYYFCEQDGTARKAECQDNLVFNFQIGSCDWPERVSGSSVPMSRDLPIDAFAGRDSAIGMSFRPMPFDAQESRLEPHLRTPPRPKVFNCVPGKYGFFADVTTKCQGYYYCRVDGKNFSFTCPNNLRFNEKLGACDLPSNVNCLVSGSPGFAQLRVAKADKGFSFDCQGKTGLFVDKESETCRTFFHCEFDSFIPFQCSEGLRFNSVIKACDKEENVKCRVSRRHVEAGNHTSNKSHL